MSLDAYLESEPYETDCTCPECEHKHTRTTRDEYYSANITHNLNVMADAAGVYQALWRPEEIGIKRAEQLISILEKGLETLRSDPAKFIALEPENKYGTYQDFVPWMERYLEACRKYPRSLVRVWR